MTTKRQTIPDAREFSLAWLIAQAGVRSAYVTENAPYIHMSVKLGNPDLSVW